MAEIGLVKSKLNQNIDLVVKELLPGGKRVGAEWCVASLDGSAGESLKVHLTGDRTGLWSDFATGQSGDVIDLICAVKGVGLGEGLSWAKTFANIPSAVSEGFRKEWRRPGRPEGVTKPTDTTLAYLTETRCLNPATIEQFKLATKRHFIPIDGDKAERDCIVFPFLTAAAELAMCKYLCIDRGASGKKVIWSDPGCQPVLFGWQALDPKTRWVILCEGEINAMSWSQYGFPALATPRGAGKGAKHDWIAEEWENLERFDTIFLNFDPDEAGLSSLKDLPARLGQHRCKIVPALPFKDANDCLREQVGREVMEQALKDAKTADPEYLRPAEVYVKDTIRAFYPEPGDDQGFDLPYVAAGGTKLRLGEMSLWTGYSYHGKTGILGQVAVVAATQGAKCLTVSLEMRQSQMFKRLCRQMTAMREPSIEYIERAFDWMSGKFWVFDQQRATKLDILLPYFDYVIQRYGVNFIVIDSLMKLGIAPEDYAGQKAAVEGLHTYALNNNVHLALVAHPRKAINEDSPPSRLDVAGAGNITDMPDQVFIQYRNIPKEKAKRQHFAGLPTRMPIEEVERQHDNLLICEKDRNGDGDTWSVPLWYNADSMQFRDSPRSPIRPLIPFNLSLPVGGLNSDIGF